METSTGRGPFMHRTTGQRYYLLDPKPEDIAIEDIATSLSLQCRFNGQLKAHYSIAQHALICSKVDSKYARELLLHDAAEAYVGDLTRPVCWAIGAEAEKAFRDLEDRHMKVIAQVFRLDYPFHPRVKEVDDLVLETELAFIREDKVVFEPITIAAIRRSFMNRFEELFGEIQLS